MGIDRQVERQPRTSGGYAGKINVRAGRTSTHLSRFKPLSRQSLSAFSCHRVLFHRVELSFFLSPTRAIHIHIYLRLWLSVVALRTFTILTTSFRLLLLYFSAFHSSLSILFLLLVHLSFFPFRVYSSSLFSFLSIYVSLSSFASSLISLLLLQLPRLLLSLVVIRLLQRHRGVAVVFRTGRRQKKKKID